MGNPFLVNKYTNPFFRLKEYTTLCKDAKSFFKTNDIRGQGLDAIVATIKDAELQIPNILLYIIECIKESRAVIETLMEVPRLIEGNTTTRTLVEHPIVNGSDSTLKGDDMDNYIHLKRLLAGVEESLANIVECPSKVQKDLQSLVSNFANGVNECSSKLRKMSASLRAIVLKNEQSLEEFKAANRKTKVVEWESESDRVKRELKEKEAQIEKLRKQLEEMKTEKAELDDKYKELSDQIKELTAELVGLNEEQSKRTNLKRDVANLSSTIAQREKHIRKLLRLKNTLEEAEAYEQQLAEAISAAESTIHENEMTLERLRDELKVLDTTRSNISKLERELAAEESKMGDIETERQKILQEAKEDEKEKDLSAYREAKNPDKWNSYK